MAPIWMATLGDAFGQSVVTAPLPSPHWVAQSPALADELGLRAWLSSDDALLALAGHPVDGPKHNRASLNWPMPFASAYSGHQFGVWAGALGDGRAHTLGALATPMGSVEVQLKGCGLTPYSRMGDGRAVLRSSIREFLASEAMHALGIPTTRALAVVGSAMPVRREQIETAAVVTRTAASFVRFGHFEHVTHTLRDRAGLQRLADTAIDRHFADVAALGLTGPQRYCALLASVASRTAALMAQWQAVGFCHGVMNTDNMSLLGLTLDYGPFGFLDAYDSGHVCNHSDTHGRYAYGNQPGVAHWNLSALAHALMPLIEDIALVRSALAGFAVQFRQATLQRMRAKLGLPGGAMDDPDLEAADVALIDDWLSMLAADRVDFTIAHRRLASPTVDLRDLFLDRERFDAWHDRLWQRLDFAVDAEVANARRLKLLAVNPKYILRNHLAQTAIARAEAGDFDEVARLHKLLSRPFDEQPGHESDADFPPAWAQHLEVSCSS